jgi:hypothetical protein
VPGRGLEPLRIAPPDPKSGASANFATLASILIRLTYILDPSDRKSETYPLELHAGGMAGKCPRCKSISFEAVF